MLNWKPCDLDLSDEIKAAMRERGYCATLEVPLDYTNPQSDKTVELQLIRFNATKEPFKGSVLWNPGGPGISGIETFATLGPDFRDLADVYQSIIGGHHHAISFDPRKLPQADLWSYIKNQKWAELSAIADACYATQQEYGRYISTAFTARDMMKIVDALGEDGKLRYWGISYGTILGQVVASLFPDRIGRLLLDSNSLADSYLTATGIGGPRDAEKSLMYMFSECVKVGPKTCRLANYAGRRTTVEDLREAVEDLFQKLTEMKNLPAGLSKEEYPSGGNSVLARLKLLIVEGLSSPGGYPKVATMLFQALNGRWKKALAVEETPASEWNRGTEAFAGIACSDSSFRVQDPNDLYPMYRAHLAESSMGDAIAADYLGCGAWRFQAAEGVDTDKLRNVNTSFPALIINGAYDPVTSLTHAWQVSSRFKGSRMLVHEGVGHGVTYHASNCTLDAIATYFRDGVLPEVGAVCKPNMLAFEYAKLIS
ncbi:uncharacterized protein NECHADRAFT_98068 [Fusarium vanettenii 77-13-4]|uniref:Peptidase S33 tripeptidyl aminopeptidase-like C-terminal domain-containing protein n=1 Tax=Fusarium vanettenii (strain ATCC MYA-4622 / CBS 123669 / FGSC 9596 / NRRL 45880 / 77-13-4) TaxID=660122 RepID=C7ZDJ1_FUSV7|nr:uncharacterized protein NECHADRAFT_98068 [Fusarium vanettenii 77-13-4]EEU37837.1 hypothetical protein NECHADRAFT_98068 [Fusarium vanettenii 77-13-4]